MKIVLAATGASGSIYLQRLLDRIDSSAHEVHLVLSDYAKQVLNVELADGLQVADTVHRYGNKTMSVPFVSGSSGFDAMVIVPCSMGTLARIAHGTSEGTIGRAADVFLKEKKPLIIVPRETPWSLIHARNVVSLIEAGATILPAMPSFYSQPTTLEAAVDTVVWRILQHIGLPADDAFHWQEEEKKKHRPRRLANNKFIGAWFC